MCFAKALRIGASRLTAATASLFVFLMSINSGAVELNSNRVVGGGNGAKSVTPKQAARSVKISGGVYSPLFREPDEVDRQIPPFKLDKYAVTRAEFQNFLAKNPHFLSKAMAARLADSNYLEGWIDGQAPAGTSDWPVTSVSWFAARAYCKSVGGHLPRVDEWEFAARAEKKENLQRILDWYSQPADALRPVKALKPDPATGLVGMHGIVWEWVEDFSSVIVQGDSRSSNDTDKDLFCAAGAMKAKRPEEYATFMRFAFRSSLKAKSAARSLGFRCAYD
ncbi:MAG: formylglycine-generating enzyme family protein [Deltaproteobacteria bacterium]|nr:formylglycine-generating enzyme family protein [Deltaproteobacteria bacterium]